MHIETIYYITFEDNFRGMTGYVETRVFHDTMPSTRRSKHPYHVILHAPDPPESDFLSVKIRNHRSFRDRSHHDDNGPLDRRSSDSTNRAAKGKQLRWKDQVEAEIAAQNELISRRTPIGILKPRKDKELARSLRVPQGAGLYKS